jgi:hypothetical protein
MQTLRKQRAHRRVIVAIASSALIGCASAAPDTISITEAPIEDGIDRQRAAVGTPGFHPVAPCLNESDYVSRAAVRFLDGHYTPRCLRLASGGTVVFQGAFVTHPLEPRPIETVPSPIVPTNSGGQVEFEFPDHGFYPYRDAAHPQETGVVWSNYF